jgi:hypothetical protein
MRTLFQIKMSSLLILAVTVVLWLGCATYNKFETSQKNSSAQIQMLQEQSSGNIPCPPEKIEITGYTINKSGGNGYWTAIGCDGKTYNCTRSGEDRQDVNCSPADPDLIN